VIAGILLVEVVLLIALRNEFSWQVSCLVLLAIFSISMWYVGKRVSKSIAIPIGLVTLVVGMTAMSANSHLLELKRSLQAKEFELVHFPARSIQPRAACGKFPLAPSTIAP